MEQRAALVAVAAGQVGYQEGKNNDTKFGFWYGMNNQPWCAMFVSWCASQAGISTDVIPRFAYVPNGVAFFRARGQYHQRGGYQPVAGDIVFFGNSDHVGIVEQVSGSNVSTIEGNTSPNGDSSNGEGVYRRTRPLNNSWIMGYGHPAYQETARQEEDDRVKIAQVNIWDLDRDVLIPVSAVNIDGVNYVRLRDTEKLFPVKVSFDEQAFVPTITMNYHDEP